MTIEKNLLKLSWPIYIELLFFMLMGISDTLMLSQYSDLAVASVGNANKVLGLFTVLLNIVAIGVSVVVSQYLGAKDKENAKSALKAGMISNAMIGFTIFLLLQLFAGSLFKLIQLDQTIYQDTIIYMRIVSIGLLFLSITQAMSSGFKSHGQTKTIMYIVGFTNLVNVIGNYLLIFGVGFLPELGVRGAAFSTLFSRFLSMLIAMVVLHKKLGIHPLKIRLKPVMLHFKKIIKVGIPSALEQFVYQITQVVLLTFMNMIGVVAVTAQVYVFNLMMPVLVFSLAVAQGNQVIVGYHVGASDYEDAYQRSIRTVKLSIGVVIAIAFTMYLYARPLLSIFTDNQEIIVMGQRVMMVVVFLEGGRLLNLVLIQSLRAAGDVVFPVIIAVFSMLGVSVGLAYLLGIHLGLGLVGIFLGLAADELTRGLIVLSRWIKGSWKGKQVIQET
jgi:putative MATE family efflux protein